MSVTMNLKDGQFANMTVNGVPIALRAAQEPDEERLRITIAAETDGYEAFVLGAHACLSFWGNPQPDETIAAPDEAREPAEPDAPAADGLLDLHGRVAQIIKRAYFVHTRNEQKAYETGLAVLEEVQRTYAELAEQAGLPTQ